MRESNLPEEKMLDFAISDFLKSMAKGNNSDEYESIICLKIRENFRFNFIRKWASNSGDCFNPLLLMSVLDRYIFLDYCYNRPEALKKIRGIGNACVSSIKKDIGSMYYTRDFYPMVIKGYSSMHRPRCTTMQPYQTFTICKYISSLNTQKSKEFKTISDLRDTSYDLLNVYESLHESDKNIARSYINGVLDKINQE